MKSYLILVALLFNFTISAFAADVVVPPTGGSDDWSNIQSRLNQGDRVILISGATYKISQRLNINYSNSGITSDSIQPATIRMLPTFNYANPDITSAGPRLDQTNGIGIYVGENLQNPINKVGVVSNIQLSNLRLSKDHVDGSYVSGIWLFGASNVQIENVELSGFSLGYIIALDSVQNVRIKDSTIMDSWANVAPKDQSGKYFTKMPQLTGIQIDDNKIKIESGENFLSKNILITNNTIARLRFGNNLFNISRKNFGNESGGNLGFETDGITIGGSDTPVAGGKDNVVVTMNHISQVGEGIDSFATNYLIKNNFISDTFLFGVKLIHGARDAVVENNTIQRAGLNGIVLGGSSRGTTHASGNIIRNNNISDTGNRAFACGSNVNNSSTFRLTDHCGTSESVGIKIQHNGGTEDKSMVKNAFIVNNTLDKGIILERSAVNTVILNNNIENAGRIKLIIESGATGTISDVAAVSGSYQSEPIGSKLIYADFNGDSLNDIFLSWDGSGKNYLYLNSANKSGNIFTRIDNPIPSTGINGYPDYLLHGNFDGDSSGKTDLIFVWKSTGQNRAIYNFSNGSFMSGNVSNPISPTAINGDSTHTIAGDFDGNGMDDICFIWKNSGLNRCAYSFGLSTFSTYVETISPNAINSDPDVFIGDFNGDGKSDLYFIWRGDGTNRLFHGNAAGSFVVYDAGNGSAPIGPLAINGGADKIMSEDFNADGIDDINFFWTPINSKRLFLGSSTGAFHAD